MDMFNLIIGWLFCVMGLVCGFGGAICAVWMIREYILTIKKHERFFLTENRVIAGMGGGMLDVLAIAFLVISSYFLPY